VTFLGNPLAAEAVEGFISVTSAAGVRDCFWFAKAIHRSRKSVNTARSFGSSIHFSAL